MLLASMLTEGMSWKPSHRCGDSAMARDTSAYIIHRVKGCMHIGITRWNSAKICLWTKSAQSSPGAHRVPLSSRGSPEHPRQGFSYKQGKLKLLAIVIEFVTTQHGLKILMFLLVLLFLDVFHTCLFPFTFSTNKEN